MALVLLGALSLRDDDTDAFGRWSVRGGLLGALLLTAADAGAAWQLAGPPRRDQALYALGIGVGLATAAAYVAAARRVPPASS